MTYMTRQQQAVLDCIAACPGGCATAMVLADRLRSGGQSVGLTTVYRQLERLEKQGLLESEWEIGEARPRKYYRISPLGRKVLAALTTEWNDTVEVMHLILYGEKHV